MNQQPQQVNIKANEEMLKGVYTNLALINHSKDEFVLDFAFMNQINAQLVSRVITNPAHFKALVKALQTNLDNYERQFGSIEAAKEPSGKLGF